MKTTTAERLKQIMDERHYKQVDIIRLAQPLCELYKIKLGRNDISQYLSGKAEPRQNKLYVLSKALNVSEAWLMGYDVPMQRDIQADDKSNTQYVQIESNNIELSPDEQRLIMDYRQLNNQGQKLIQQQMFMAKEIYKKNNSVSDVGTVG